MIKFDNVSYRYPFQKTWAVKNLDLEVLPGKVLLVTGVSGCGKTTLMRLANGLCPHYYTGEILGHVTVFGEDSQKTSVSAISDKVGTLFQDPEDQFFALNVKDEMGFALKVSGTAPSVVNERIEQVSQRLSIENLLSHSISALSEGQKQRVALGEILVSEPQALILDEPSANLDPEATDRLAQELLRLKQAGFAILVVDHRLHWLSHVADEVIVMQHGEIKERGPFAILEDAGMRKRYGLREARVEDVRNTLPEKHVPSPILKTADLTFDYEKANHHSKLAKFKKLFKGNSKNTNDILLKNIHFEVGSGITALIGENGSGKTTLARLITGLNVGTGALYLNGQQTSANQLLKHTGLVLQNADHQLQMQSVREEIHACLFAAGQSQSSEETIDVLLKTFSLEELADRHPQSLSGGQKQRLVIACAMAKNPDILILDEPTSGLDGANMKRVADALREQANQGKAVLLITHDLELLTLCADQALRMNTLKRKELFNTENLNG
ncbi:ABC transporter ATP-binding protein [Parasutterella secunda]|uniref:ABC transporter ATP-binding protein n=1 Tax=Parasutterella secunda TaxID=626947 RepID=UPI0021ACA3DC|nr:ABC transporter ATP-binding protein [Parasutterella secunda]MCR8920302.1 ABC transporter ATP-binding protein [Parasutterella secunda]